ncbi:hypothetical protein BCR44DRAFT_178961 [Catenaria anguillulae PL171]|uniref:Uncharacterized protein n=1 Tax=Catenaria anguillulae PL171 TaxID=765915 RepID=A0A1Y2HAJ4_9FUNG|nr:hypothetical protein BCR44DRAFT_178961 [Catenaria anguillulae PL171]
MTAKTRDDIYHCDVFHSKISNPATDTQDTTIVKVQTTGDSGFKSASSSSSSPLSTSPRRADSLSSCANLVSANSTTNATDADAAEVLLALAAPSSCATASNALSTVASSPTSNPSPTTTAVPLHATFDSPADLELASLPPAPAPAPASSSASIACVAGIAPPSAEAIVVAQRSMLSDDELLAGIASAEAMEEHTRTATLGWMRLGCRCNVV